MEFLSWIYVHKWIVIIAVTIIWGILAYIYSSRKRKKRAGSLKEFLPQQLMHSSPNENIISKFKKQYTGVIPRDVVYQCFIGSKDWSKAMNLIEGNMGSIDYVTYDYKYIVRGNGGEGGGFDETFRGTAILLQSDKLALPSFRWGRKWVRGGVQPEIPPKQSGSKQCPTCGSFDIRRGTFTEGGGFGNYCEHCKKSLSKIEKEKNEEKVHKLFMHVSTRDLHGWTALASNTQLLLYRKSRVRAKKYQEFIENALKIFQMFQSALEIEGKPKHAIVKKDYSLILLIGGVIFVFVLISAGAFLELPVIIPGPSGGIYAPTKDGKDSSGTVAYHKGVANEYLGKYQRAIEDYSQAIRLEPNNINAYHRRGGVYEKLDKYQRAIEDYNQAIRLYPYNAKGYNSRGIVYYMLGELERACSDYQKACELGLCKRFNSAKKKGDCVETIRDDRW